jgi:hypothetical protein
MIYCFGLGLGSLGCAEAFGSHDIILDMVPSPSGLLALTLDILHTPFPHYEFDARLPFDDDNQLLG